MHGPTILGGSCFKFNCPKHCTTKIFFHLFYLREREDLKYINMKDNFRAKEKNLILNYNNKKGINHVCCKLERLSLNLFNYIFLYDMKGMWVLLSYLKPNLQGQGVHSTHPYNELESTQHSGCGGSINYSQGNY